MAQNLLQVLKLLNNVEDHLTSWKVENFDQDDKMMNLAAFMDTQLFDLKDSCERLLTRNRKVQEKNINQRMLRFINHFSHLKQLIHNPDRQLENHVIVAKRYEELFECNKFFKQFKIPFENFNKKIYFDYLGICYFENKPNEGYTIFSFAVFPDGIHVINEEKSWHKFANFLHGIGVPCGEGILCTFPEEKLVIRFFQGNTIHTTNMIKAAKIMDQMAEVQPQFDWMLTFLRRWFVVTEWFSHITDDILQILLVVYLQHNNFVPKGKDILNRFKGKKITPYVPFKELFFEMHRLDICLEDFKLSEMPNYKELVEDFFEFFDCYPPGVFTFNAFQGTVNSRIVSGSSEENFEIGTDVSGSIHIMVGEDICGLEKFLQYSLYAFRRKKLIIDEPTEMDSADIQLPDLKRIKLINDTNQNPADNLGVNGSADTTQPIPINNDWQQNPFDTPAFHIEITGMFQTKDDFEANYKDFGYQTNMC